MKRVHKNSQVGTSIIELLIVLTIAAILVTASVAMFGRSTANLHRQNVARQFKNYLERSRFDSIKRHANDPTQMATVEIVNPGRFTVTVDRNQNGNLEVPAETTIIDIAAVGMARIASSDFAYPITIKFDYRGQVTVRNGNNAEIDPIFYFCDTICISTTANVSNSNIIYISPTGTVAMMRGGDIIPTFDNPAITSIASTTSVNPQLAVWDLDSAVPSPTPAPTPTPTPTPAPTPSPTPSTTPTPTPAPPPACQSGQDVSLPCTCVSPMWKRSNGKCR